MTAPESPPGTAGRYAADPWLNRWLPLLREASAARPVLELGCDTGIDTAWLLGQGFAVTATDIAADALAECARQAPGATLLAHDLRAPLPFADGQFGAVLASLCLHYFPWPTTQAAVVEIHRCLAPGGLLLCRLNSTRDVLHGATGYEEIEPNYYRVNARYGENKRFFDRAAIDALFEQGWQVVSVQELTNHRYEQPKVAWEVVLRKGTGPAGRDLSSSA